MKVTTLKNMTYTFVLSIGFLLISCGGSNESESPEATADSTAIAHNCDDKCDKNGACGDKCDKNKMCSDSCKKNCENPENCMQSSDSTTEEVMACEAGGCAPGACGGGE